MNVVSRLAELRPQPLALVIHPKDSTTHSQITTSSIQLRSLKRQYHLQRIVRILISSGEVLGSFFDALTARVRY